MAYDEDVARRIRRLLADVPGVTEKKMFGGLAFLLHGNMVCGPNRDLLIVRVPPGEHEAALAEPGADEMMFTKRPMRGWVQVDAAALRDDDVLETWVQRAVDYASSLPRKSRM